MALNSGEAASDIRLEVQRAPYQKGTSLEGGGTYASIRSRIEAARTLQLKRFHTSAVVVHDYGLEHAGVAIASIEDR